MIAIMPETSGMPDGTQSIAMRTGTRCAKRIEVYTGSTLGRACVPAVAIGHTQAARQGGGTPEDELRVASVCR